MFKAKTYVYRLEYNKQKFDYYSIFDNNLVNSTYKRAEDMTKISIMELGLIKGDTDTPQTYQGIINGAFVPFQQFLGDAKEANNKDICLLLDSSDACIQLKKFEALCNLPEYYKTVFYYQFSQGSKDEIKRAAEAKHYIFTPINDTLFSVHASEENKVSLFSNNDNMEMVVSRCLSKYIYDQLYEDTRCIENVYSSNLFSNHYINLRKVFSDGSLAALVTTRLLHMIMNTNNLKFDAFICASITGACIASYLSVYIKKPVLFLRNIGPDITTDDDLIVERIYPRKKYVYIFDFMCLGTEYQRTKMICALKKSSIIQSFGISFYKKPNRGKPEDIQTIFGINDFSEDDPYFVCSVNQNDLEANDKKQDVRSEAK